MKHLLTFCILVLAAIPASSQTMPGPRGALVPDAPESSTAIGGARISDRTGYPLALYSSDFRARIAPPEEMALEFLAERGARLGVLDLATLEHASTLRTRSGFRVRFDQYQEGVRVYRSGIAISIGFDGAVHFVANDYKPGVKLYGGAAKTGIGPAIAAAQAHVAFEGAPIHEEEQLVLFANGGQSRLARRVQLITASGAWDILVDANSGRVFRAVPTAHVAPEMTPAPFSSQRTVPGFSQPRFKMKTTPASRRLDGTGMVFDPDPLSAAQVEYGWTAAYSDNGDSDSPELTAARTAVTLRDISQDGAIFNLRGPLVEIADLYSPFNGIFGNVSPDFDRTRSEPGFEATMLYYHLDQSLRYVQDLTGMSTESLFYDGPFQVDPHGLDESVNAQFLFTGNLRFGDGGADMGEDGDVVLHELGHALHRWITGGNSSSAAGLGEGSGDYWAASYARSKGFWPAGNPGREVMGHWGGRPFFGGRRTDYGATFPQGLTGAIHTDGQIWSSAMMSIWDKVGKEITDLLFLEGLSMTGGFSDTDDAANAVLKADSILFAGAHAADMIDSLVEHGFIFRAVAAAAGRAGPPPLAVNFIDLSTFGTGGSLSREWDFDGDGQVDATGFAPGFTFHTPGLFSVTLTASGGDRTIKSTLEDYVSVNGGIYVWEGSGNPADRSGRYIFDRLQDAGVEAVYSRTAQIHPSLEGFDAVFLSFGPSNPQNTPTPLQDIPARVIRDYIRGGGNVYLEGGDALGFQQASNTALLELFGIAESQDGDPRQLKNLRGQGGSLAAGLLFASSKQTSNFSIDQFTPGGTGRPMFVEEGYGIVGVQNQDAGGGRTVTMAYTLADLDRNGDSSRDAVLTSILDFFGIAVVLDSQDEPALPSSLRLESIYPNPVSGQAVVRFTLDQPGSVDIGVFDMLGRRVASLASGDWKPIGEHEVGFDTASLSDGVYLISIRAGGQVDRQSIVVAR